MNFKLTITDTSGVKDVRSGFASASAARAWLASKLDMYSLASEQVKDSTDRIVLSELKVIDTEAVAEVVDSAGAVTTPAVAEVSHIEYVCVAASAYVIEDITTETEEAESQAEAEAIVVKSNKLRAMIIRFNKANLASGKISTAQFLELRANSNFLLIREYLLEGSLELAKAAAVSAKESLLNYFTEDQYEEFIGSF